MVDVLMEKLEGRYTSPMCPMGNERTREKGGWRMTDVYNRNDLI